MTTTVAEEVARSLSSAGIDTVFGLPGGEVTALIEALRAEGMRFVLTKHETSAAFAAQTYGLLSGVPGFAVTTLGPGVTNVVSGVAAAHLERAPLIVCCANLPSRRQSLVTHQRLPIAELFGPISKGVIALTTGNVAGNVRRAVDVAMGDRPGPVVLELASDIALQPVSETRPAAGLESAIDVMAQAVDMPEQVYKPLAAAKNPIIVVGWDAGRAALREPEHLPEALSALAGVLHAPVIVTPKAKGVIAEDSPWFLGVAEGVGTAAIFDLLARADEIVCVGLDAVEFDRWWDFPGRVTALATMADRDHCIPAAARITAPFLDLLETLARALAGRVTVQDAEATVPRSTAAISQWRTAHLTIARSSDEGVLEGHEVAAALRRAAPRDTVLVTDVGVHKLVAAQVWQSFAPGQYHLSNGLSSMGFALPTAMAVKIAHPGAPVIALVGDGGLAMTGFELETLRRERIPLVVVTLVDDTLMLIRQGQVRRGYAPTGVDFTNPDLVALAAAFHLRGLRATTVSEVEESLRVALTLSASERQPVLIEVPITRRSY